MPDPAILRDGRRLSSGGRKGGLNITSEFETGATPLDRRFKVLSPNVNIMISITSAIPKGIAGTK